MSIQKVECQYCGSERIVKISARCKDECTFSMGKFEVELYIPKDMGIGGEDVVKFSYCLECGQIQGKFPKKITKFEKAIEKAIKTNDRYIDMS